MAATWIKPIKISKGKSITHTINQKTSYIKNPEKTTMETTAASTAYAINPHKTDSGELVKGYCCDPRTVDEEFLLSKKEYEYLTGRSNGNRNIIAYHIRQSFKPGEITPQEAQEIGYELALRFTKGKHAFIVATHVDKAHTHNHIIFNSTSIDCRSKYNNFFLSSFAIRKLSDLICAENGLSVIEDPKPSKGKTYGLWLGDKTPTWQDKLRQKIDEVLPNCNSFEDFISIMKSDGYKVNDKGKHITLLAPEQKKPTRLNTLKGNHTEAAIRERIANKKMVAYIKTTATPTRVSLLIDIQAKIRDGKGSGYEHWARIFNIKEAAKTLIFLKENGIDSYDDLVEKASSASKEFSSLSTTIKDADKRLAEISELQKQIGIYGKTRYIYTQYSKAKNKEKFFEEHRAEITLHTAAKNYFNEQGYSKDNKLPTIASLKQEYATLSAKKKKCYSGYRDLKANMQELLIAKGNADKILGIKPKTQTQNISNVKNRNKDFDI